MAHIQPDPDPDKEALSATESGTKEAVEPNGKEAGKASKGLRAEVWFGWFLLFASLVLWPVSAFTFAKDEPKTVLALSWIAITLTAWDVVKSSRVHAQVDSSSD